MGHKKILLLFATVMVSLGATACATTPGRTMRNVVPKTTTPTTPDRTTVPNATTPNGTVTDDSTMPNTTGTLKTPKY